MLGIGKSVMCSSPNNAVGSKLNDLAAATDPCPAGAAASIWLSHVPHTKVADAAAATDVMSDEAAAADGIAVGLVPKPMARSASNVGRVLSLTVVSC